MGQRQIADVLRDLSMAGPGSVCAEAASIIKALIKTQPLVVKDGFIAELLPRLEARSYKLDKVATLFEEAVKAVRYLSQERSRLLRGDFTRDEIHNFCHDLPGTVSVKEFAAGCVREQKKLYGCAPDEDKYEILRGKIIRAEKWEDLVEIQKAVAENRV